MSIREGVLDTLGTERAVLAGVVPMQLGGWAAGAIRQVAPLLAAASPSVRWIVGALVGRLGELNVTAARQAGAVLRPLVYAADVTVRRESLARLAALVEVQPAAIGSPDWRWRATALDLTAHDPALTPAVTLLLAACPQRRRPVPAREAYLWAEAARPVA